MSRKSRRTTDQLRANADFLLRLAHDQTKDFGELLGVVARINARVNRLEWMMPKTGSPSSAPEHENKGNDMAANGLQTAEMTLEVVYDPGWLDSFEVIGDKVLRLVRKGLGKAAGESVRLVDLPLPFAAVIFERNEARDERDAAIKRAEAAELLCESQKDMMAHYVERIEALHLRCKLRHSAVKQAKARVADLEAEAVMLKGVTKADDERLRAAEVRVFGEGITWGCGAADAMADAVHFARHERDVAEAQANGLRGDVRAAKKDNGRLREQLESVACRAATAETALRHIVRAATNGAAWKARKIAETALGAAPAASGGGGLNPHAWGVLLDLRDAARVFRDSSIHDHQVRLDKALADAERLLTQPRPAVPASVAAGTEPVAYFVKLAEKDWDVQDQTFRTLERAQDYIKDEKSEDENPQIVPLHAAPQPAPGWLTAEEREAVAFAARKLRELANQQYRNGDEATATDTSREADFVDALLARSSPPEVVLPEFVPVEDWHTRDRKWIAAIAASGGKVKEVGK